MEEIIKALDYVFNPESIAVVGASRHPWKIGNIVVKNLIDGGYEGKILPINPKAQEICGIEAQPELDEQVDLAVFTVNALVATKIFEEKAELIKSAIFITSGFSEIGRYDLEERIVKVAKDYAIPLIGPNCMGVLNPAKKIDTVFIPMYKMRRPKVGNLAIISQSGAIGSVVIDLAATYNFGISKFVSYGNASVISEIELIEYLIQDKATKYIGIYLEGVKNGRRFYELLKESEKPIIVLKGGKTEKAKEVAKSHTAAVAGEYAAYKAVFRQTGAVEIERFEDLFYVPQIFNLSPTSEKIAVVTNGGGFSVLATDYAEVLSLEFAEFKDETVKAFREILPPYANIGNPLDLTGDADSKRFEKALDAVLKDKEIGVIFAVILTQTVSLDPNIIEVMKKYGQTKRIVAVLPGKGQAELMRQVIESYGIPTYDDLQMAMKAVSALFRWRRKKRF